MATLNDNMTVSGAFVAGNWAQGFVRISPRADEVTSVTLTGLNFEGRGHLYAQVTPRTEYPWKHVREVSIIYRDSNGDPASPENAVVDSLEVHLYRTNTIPTDIHWLIYRGLT